MISELRNNIKDYYWSINGDGALVCGGDGGNGHYGLIKIHISKERAEVDRESGDGMGNTMMLTTETHSAGWPEYVELVALKNEVQEYLKDQSNSAYQEGNRSGLIQNTGKLLPPPN